MRSISKSGALPVLFKRSQRRATCEAPKRTCFEDARDEWVRVKKEKFVQIKERKEAKEAKAREEANAGEEDRSNPGHVSTVASNEATTSDHEGVAAEDEL